jgi:GNAT superfamily N-acetyltransferase
VPAVSADLIKRVEASDLDDLLVLMRAYCDFYEVSPPDEYLLFIARALIADPLNEGVQLIARDSTGRAVGFATVYWSWSTTGGCRIGVMNDLFVAEDSRGRAIAERLIEGCRAECSARGARQLAWQTAPDNFRAQKVYDRVGGNREQWVDYWLPVSQ